VWTATTSCCWVRRSLVAATSEMPYETPQSTPTNRICRRVLIPADGYWLAAYSGALLELTKDGNWQQSFGGISPSDAASVSLEIYEDYMMNRDIGEIGMFVVTETPTGWLQCDGATHNRVDYPELYDVITPNLKIDSETFKTPNFLDRVPRGFPPIVAGFETGSNTANVTTDNLPEHTHTTKKIVPATIVQGELVPIAVAQVIPGSDNTGTTGNNEPLDVSNAAIAVTYCIYSGRVLP